LGIVFGPVPSRRLGYSLGIDVLPPADKMCTLNCVYCQVGHTKVQTIKRGIPLDSTLINQAIDEHLPMADIDVVTFSGSGEPTLHRYLGQFIERVKNRCDTPVAVLTNSTLIDKPDVRRDLALADIVVPSLDAATQETFERINRPHRSLRVDSIIEGLIAFRDEFSGKFFLEIMLVKGFNDDPSELLAIKKIVDRIRPDQVHLNTVTRPGAEPDARPLAQNELERIAAIFGPDTFPIGTGPAVGRVADVRELEAAVLDLVQRRGVTLSDLVKSLGLERARALEVLNNLAQQNKVKKVVHGEVTYYREYY